MTGDLNAYGLITVVVMTVILLAIYGRKPFSLRAGLIYLAGFTLLTMLFCPVWESTYPPSHGPYHQWFIPAFCGVLIVAFARPKWVKVIGGALAFLLAVFLTTHAVDLGDPGATRTCDPHALHAWASMRMTRNLEMLRYKLHREADLNASYPAGWLSEQRYRTLMADVPEHRYVARSYTTYRFWHTWLTGIHGVRYTDLELWYPGGKLSETLDKIEYRQRQE